MTKFYALVKIHLFAILESFITLSTESTKLRCFSHVNLAVKTLSKNCLNYSRQRKHHKCEHFLSKEKCSECLLAPFTYPCKTISKTLGSFLNWTCRKVSRIFSSVIVNSETVIGFG